MKSKKGLLIGGIIGGVALVGAIVAILIIFLGKKEDTYRVIKVMKAEGHSYVTRGDITDLEAANKLLYKASYCPHSNLLAMFWDYH